jgi:WD40 repeat protein
VRFRNIEIEELRTAERVGEVRRFSEGLQKQAWRFRAAFTADGQGVYASSGQYPLAVMLWDRHTGALISQFDIDSGPNAFSLSLDRKVMVLGSVDGRVQVAQAPDGTLYNRLEGVKSVIWCSAINAAGDRVAVGDDTGKVHVWDRPSGKLLWSKQVEPRPVRGLAISPDGTTLAAGGNSSSVVLCELDTGKEIRRLDGTSCIDCAFSRDGKRLVTTGSGAEVLIWDLPAGKVLRRIVLPSCIDVLALAPDEQHLATGTYDGMVRWWDLNTGAELHCFHAHPGGVLGVAVSPDGKYLLSSGKDGPFVCGACPTRLRRVRSA